MTWLPRSSHDLLALTMPLDVSVGDQADGESEEDTSRPQVVKPQRPRQLGMRCSPQTVRVAGGSGTSVRACG